MSGTKVSLPTMDTQLKVASEAAQSFVDHYYEARTRRRPLATFYASTSARLTGAGAKPDISVNGQPVADVAAYEAVLETQGGPVLYEVSSFDAQPVSARFRTGEPEPPAENSREATAAAAEVRNGDRLSFAIQVSGTIRYTHEHTAARGGEDAKPAPAPPAEGASAFAVGTTPAEGELPEQDFNEAFLLVPHWEAWARNAPRNLRKWVIVSQNYRTL
ncbi:hypothetical protein F4781DRAFT_426406 [Annulohypoxylon bovei var. microspora]|nr:hypothetical protein F4781DRAFT_426406 [Annulohypoxylon bovei var. microspora]